MTALVTGASGGIGSAVCRELAAAGYDIAVHYNKNKKAALSLCKELQERFGVRTCLIKADLTDKNQVEFLAKSALDFGEVSVLVNNAGLSYRQLFQLADEEKASDVFAVNCTSAMLLTKLVLPSMIARHSGRIINISSMWGVTGGSCEVHYSAAKAGLIGFTKALAKEVGPSGITVNCIAPGLIDTEMNSEIDDTAKKDIIEETPMSRIGQPEDVAAAVGFFAGKNASFITGQTLCVDGGITI
ncbi:MAG: elongation factor P 5-aminopentanone reductase [Acutalibacteraceae bacterium]